MYDGYEYVDDVVEFKDPNESNFGAPSEYIIIRNIPLLAGMVEFLVSGHLHEVVIHGYK